jgi:DNA-binding phage protein
MKRKHPGTAFDDFLREDGILSEATATAIKRVVAFQIQQEMRRRKLSKTVIAKKMNTSRSALERLLDPNNPSVTLRSLERVATVLGKRLVVELA